MRTIIVGLGLWLCGTLAAGAADPTPPPLEKAPLPPGPWVAKMPVFATWRITFSYPSDKAAKPESIPKPGAAVKTSDAMPSAPRVVAITRTQPIYHVAVADVSGHASELWFDGNRAYLQLPGHPVPFVPPVDASGTAQIPSVLNYSHGDFPDVEWVSPQTYLGVLNTGSTKYLIFRHGDVGPTVWIDADSRRPARWQYNGELRSFEYLDAPTEALTLPPAVLEVSKMAHRIDEVSSHRPPRGS